MNRERLEDLVFRGWLYFRIGHGTYWHYFLSFAQWIVIVYTLYVAKTPLGVFFKTMRVFVLAFVPIYLSLSLLAGYFHYRLSKAYKKEAEVTTEENPYVFRVPKGSKEEWMLRYNVFATDMMLRMAKALQVVKTEEEEEKWRSYIRMFEHLRRGKDIREFKEN